MRIARLAILLVVLACTTSGVPERLAPVAPYPPSDVDVSLFLAGDAGVGANPMLAALRDAVAARVSEVGEDRVAVVFEGDNVYPAGVPANASTSPRLAVFEFRDGETSEAFSMLLE